MTIYEVDNNNNGIHQISTNETLSSTKHIRLKSTSHKMWWCDVCICDYVVTCMIVTRQSTEKHCSVHKRWCSRYGKQIHTLSVACAVNIGTNGKFQTIQTHRRRPHWLNTVNQHVLDLTKTYTHIYKVKQLPPTEVVNSHGLDWLLRDISIQYETLFASLLKLNYCEYDFTKLNYHRCSLSTQFCAHKTN